MNQESIEPTTFEDWIEKYLQDLATEFTPLAKKTGSWKGFLLEDNVMTNVSSLKKAVEYFIKDEGKAPNYLALKSKISFFESERNKKSNPGQTYKLHCLTSDELDKWVEKNYPNTYKNTKKNITVSWMIRLLRDDLWEGREQDSDKIAEDFFKKFNPDFKANYGFELTDLANNGFKLCVKECMTGLRERTKPSLLRAELLDLRLAMFEKMKDCIKRDLKRFYNKELKQ